VIAGLLGVSALATAAATLTGHFDARLGTLSAGVLFALSVVTPQVEKLQKFVTGLQQEKHQRQLEEKRRREEQEALLVYRGPVRLAWPVDLGVSPSRIVEEAERKAAKRLYVERRCDAELRRRLREQEPFVLLVGDSKAGKSRTAFEALQAEEVGLRDHVLIAPTRFRIKPDALNRIFQLITAPDLGTEPAILWLDDLDRYLDAGALTPSLLSAWRQGRPPVMVVATMRRGDYDRIRFGRWRGSPLPQEKRELLEQARTILERATVQIVSAALETEAERAAATAAFGDRGWTDVGLGEVLILGPKLIEKLRISTCPRAALVYAVVDWQRMGMSRPILERELRELWPRYVGWLGCKHAASTSLDDAISWGTDVIEESDSALVVDLGGPSYSPDDYVRAYRDGQGGPGLYQAAVPTKAWEWAIATVEPSEAFSIALAAYSRREADISLMALDKASGAIDPLVVAAALLNKGLILAERGRSQDELAAYDQIVARFGADPAPGLREQVANALWNKALTLGQLNRPEDELAAYEQIVAGFGGDTEPALRERVANALVNKAITLGELNRPEDGLAVYEQIVARFGADPAPALREQVAKALVNKALTLGELNRPEDGLAVYDQVVAQFGGDTEPALREQVEKAVAGREAMESVKSTTRKSPK